LPNFCELKSLFIIAIGAELLAIVLILAMGDALAESWDELGLLSIFVQWIALASAGVLCLLRRALMRLSAQAAAVTAYLVVMLITMALASLTQYLLIFFDYAWSNNPEMLPHFVTRCLMISAIITFVTLRYFYIQQQWKQRIQLESQARLQALQAKIRPHFLFNSMNIIASLIGSRPQLAEQAVEDLAELFRATLKDSNSLVLLREEYALCQHYLRIEKLRLGERLNLIWSLESLPKDALIPMLSLQPLMENAIYHGIQALPEGGTITVVGSIQGNVIQIKIKNPIPAPSTAAQKTGNQIAITNIQHRLHLLFKEQATLKLQGYATHYEAVLQIPYTKENELND
jgi:two-component system sensor histidine kinase AlgZ